MRSNIPNDWRSPKPLPNRGTSAPHPFHSGIFEGDPRLGEAYDNHARPGGTDVVTGPMPLPAFMAHRSVLDGGSHRRDSANAQSAPGSTAATSAMSIVHNDDVAVVNPRQPDFVVTDLPMKLGLPSFKDTHRPPHRFAGNMRDDPFGQQRLGSRDSLRNGAIIGAVIGAAAFGAFAAVLCNAYQEEDGASCLPDTHSVLRPSEVGLAPAPGWPSTQHETIAVSRCASPSDSDLYCW